MSRSSGNGECSRTSTGGRYIGVGRQFRQSSGRRGQSAVDSGHRGQRRGPLGSHGRGGGSLGCLLLLFQPPPLEVSVRRHYGVVRAGYVSAAPGLIVVDWVDCCWVDWVDWLSGCWVGWVGWVGWVVGWIVVG